MKALLITKCSDSQMWYAKLIGEVVPFVRFIDEEFLSREPSGYTNIVLKDDAELIDID